MHSQRLCFQPNCHLVLDFFSIDKYEGLVLPFYIGRKIGTECYCPRLVLELHSQE